MNLTMHSFTRTAPFLMHDQCSDLGELIKDYVSGLTVDLIDRNRIEAHPGPIGSDEVRVFSDYP